MKSRSYLLASLTLASAHVVKRDLTIQTLDKWGSLGCYSDSQSSRTLSVAAHFGPHVSDTNCQYQCQQLGYAYAGTEYSGQCYCDNNVNPVAVQKPDSDCNMACTGDNTQPCGGPDRINLFWNGTMTAAPTPVAANTSTGADGWSAVGCYTDDTGKRGLPVRVNTAGGASQMTTKTCVDACYAAGYTLAGTEYADECYCGNAIQNGQSLASDQTTCSMACKGDATTLCGGPGRMNLYSYGGASPAVASPAATSAAATVKPTLPAGWTTLGCYSDNTGKRALNKLFINEPSSGMTVEYCTAGCAAAGYNIAGVEYGGECYCDNTIENNQGLASDGNTGCNMQCHGNAGETCGGPNRINIYASGGWVQLGCYSDQNYQRTLAVAPSYTGSLTVEQCLGICHAGGYAYSGLEYGNECHCGSSFDNGGGPAPDGNAGCSFSCAGNSSEICGGAGRLSMYAYINPDGTISSTAAASSPKATTAGSPSAETVNIPSGWTYDGCYTDQTNGRILAHQQPDSSNLTAANCISACSASGYSIAGLEYTSQCFCDNAIQNGGSPATAGKCSMTCSGDSSKTCGGPGVMDLYSTGTLSSASAPTVQTTGLPANWAYDNCYADSVGARIFSVESDLSNASATSCIGYCSGLGYPVAGIEYADQCFCGTVAQRNAATTSTQCSMTCAGDSTHLCGGPGAMTVYVQQS